MNRLFFHIQLLIYIPGILIFFFIGCGGETDKEEPKSAVEASVQIVNPEYRDLTDFAYFNGTVIFQKKENIRAPFQGFLTKIYKNIGDEIFPGDILYQITTKEAEALDDSVKIKSGSGIFDGKVNIKAKNRSTLTYLYHTVGDFISEGEQIASTSDPSSMKIQFNIPFEYISKIKLNSMCDVILPDGTILKAIISKTVPNIESTSQTKLYYLTLDKFTNLPENLNVTIRIPINTVQHAVSLPKKAVVSNETMTEFWIFKAVNDSTAIRVNITKGFENDSIIQIIDPKLDLTDRIVSEGAFGLADTSKIKIEK
jgi:hypothetical protein